VIARARLEMQGPGGDFRGRVAGADHQRLFLLAAAYSSPSVVFALELCGSPRGEIIAESGYRRHD